MGNVGAGEREFVISPQLGCSVMLSLGLSVGSDHRVAQIKKPFDWMLDDQFHNLQVGYTMHTNYPLRISVNVRCFVVLII